MDRISFCEIEIRAREETPPPRPCRIRSTILHPARRSNRSGLLPQTRRTFARVNCKPLSQSDRTAIYISFQVELSGVTLSSFSFQLHCQMPDFLNLFPDGDFHCGFSKKIIFLPIEIILILEKDR